MIINERRDNRAAMIALYNELQAMTLQVRELRQRRSLRAVERAEQQLLAAKLKAAALAHRPVLAPPAPPIR